jgi:hypothetical protein
MTICHVEQTILRERALVSPKLALQLPNSSDKPLTRALCCLTFWVFLVGVTAKSFV